MPCRRRWRSLEPSGRLRESELLGSAVCVIVVWLFEQFLDAAVPPEVAAAFVTMISFVFTRGQRGRVPSAGQKAAG